MKNSEQVRLKTEQSRRPANGERTERTCQAKDIHTVPSSAAQSGAERWLQKKNVQSAAEGERKWPGVGRFHRTRWTQTKRKCRHAMRQTPTGFSRDTRQRREIAPIEHPAIARAGQCFSRRVRRESEANGAETLIPIRRRKPRRPRRARRSEPHFRQFLWILRTGQEGGLKRRGFRWSWKVEVDVGRKTMD